MIQMNLATHTSILQSKGSTCVLMSVDGLVVLVVCLRDAIKSSAAPAIQALTHLGITCYMVTGDNETTARSVARCCARVRTEHFLHNANERLMVNN